MVRGTFREKGLIAEEWLFQLTDREMLDCNKQKAIQAKYAIAGSGNIQAADLEAENTDASISGSGNISCYASQKLVARVKGSGDIAYKGNPQEVDAPRKNIRQIK